MNLTEREKARDLGNQAAKLSGAISDLLNDALDALQRAEARIAQLEAVAEAARQVTTTESALENPEISEAQRIHFGMVQTEGIMLLAERLAALSSPETHGTA